MEIQIDAASRQPIYRQVMVQIRTFAKQSREGECNPANGCRPSASCRRGWS